MNKTEFDKNINYLSDNGIEMSSTPAYEEKPFSVELQTNTPAGEDMIICLEEPTREEMQSYIDNFDIDENVALWWPNGHKMEDKGLPFNSMSEQIDDYKEYLEWLQDICDRWPDNGTLPRPTMKDRVSITKLEKTYMDAAQKMRPLLLASIKEAVMRLSPEKHKLILTDYNMSDECDAISVNVETDRHTGDTGFQKIDIIEASEKAWFYVETQDGYATGEMLCLDELLDIWHLLDMLTDDQSSSEPEFLIEDCIVCIADDEDED